MRLPRPHLARAARARPLTRRPSRSNNHNVTTWTSPTLESGSWVAHGNAFEVAAREVGILYRPDAIFSAETGNWTLWYNLAGSAGNIYATAVSASPFGPFVDHKRTNAFVDEGGDFHLFEDPPTGDAYLIVSGARALRSYFRARADAPPPPPPRVDPVHLDERGAE